MSLEKNQIEILDTTLREGEQTPGVSFSIEQKIKIAKLLDEIGVDFIELGHPVVSADVYESIDAINQIGLRSKRIVHSRLLNEDIQNALDLKVPWVGLFIGTSNLCLKNKYKITKQELLSLIEKKIKYCKDKGLKVRFTAEDSSRTPYKFLLEIARLAQTAGADRFSFADTVGILTPGMTKKLITQLTNEVIMPIHIHCHNDFGLATANALAAVESGAKCIDTTINGLGERCGLPPLAEITTILTFLKNKKNKWNLRSLKKISDYIDEITNLKINDLRPVTGDHAFTHKAGLHVKSVLKNPASYESIPPEVFNRQRRLMVDKYSGKKNLEFQLNRLGIKLSKSKIDNLLSSIKSSPHITSWSDEKLISTIKNID